MVMVSSELDCWQFAICVGKFYPVAPNDTKSTITSTITCASASASTSTIGSQKMTLLCCRVLPMDGLQSKVVVVVAVVGDGVVHSVLPFFIRRV